MINYISNFIFIKTVLAGNITEGESVNPDSSPRTLVLNLFIYVVYTVNIICFCLLNFVREPAYLYNDKSYSRNTCYANSFEIKKKLFYFFEITISGSFSYSFSIKITCQRYDEVNHECKICIYAHKHWNKRLTFSNWNFKLNSFILFLKK